MKFPGIGPEDSENIDAAIAAYRDGILNLDQKREPSDAAFFWGGAIKRGWGPIDEMMEWGPVKWQKENPEGKLFVEDVGTP